VGHKGGLFSGRGKGVFQGRWDRDPLHAVCPVRSAINQSFICWNKFRVYCFVIISFLFFAIFFFSCNWDFQHQQGKQQQQQQQRQLAIKTALFGRKCLLLPLGLGVRLQFLSWVFFSFFFLSWGPCLISDRFVDCLDRVGCPINYLAIKLMQTDGAICEETVKAGSKT